MKLNLNFDGKTKLKDWWDIVKKLFEEIEKEFNAGFESINTKDEEQDGNISALDLRVDENESLTAELKGKLETVEQTIFAEQSIRADTDEELSARIDNESESRQNKDIDLEKEITAETEKRKIADCELSDRITKEAIQRQNEMGLCTIAMGNDIYSCVLNSEIPEPYFNDEQKYEGEYCSADVKIQGIYKNGELIEGTSGTHTVKLWTDSEDNIVVLAFDIESGTVTVSGGDTGVFNNIADNRWLCNLYYYDNLLWEFKADSTSPTGDLFMYTGVTKSYAEPNMDTTGATYTVKVTSQEDVLEKLNTTDKSSIVAAVNELVENGQLNSCGELPIALEFVNGRIANEGGSSSGNGSSTYIRTDKYYPTLHSSTIVVTIPSAAGVGVSLHQYRADKTWIERTYISATTNVSLHNECEYFRIQIGFSNGAQISPSSWQQYINLSLKTQISKNIGDLSKLPTTDKSSIVAAINELHAAILSTGGNV